MSSFRTGLNVITYPGPLLLRPMFRVTNAACLQIWSLSSVGRCGNKVKVLYPLLSFRVLPSSCYFGLVFVRIESGIVAARLGILGRSRTLLQFWSSAGTDGNHKWVEMGGVSDDIWACSWPSEKIS